MYQDDENYRETDIEHLMSKFQGALDYGSVDKKDFVKLFKDLFDTALYKKDIYTERENGDIRIFKNNPDFWLSVLNNKIRVGNRINLRDFDIMEWIPVSPGLYFTKSATEKRKQAERWYNFERSEFVPLGKLEMICGGIGSVRLSSSRFNFLCATSNGISHQGIPLLIENHHYNRIIDEIKEHGNIRADLFGTIQVLPKDKSLIRYDREIPKYVIRIDEIEPIHPKGYYRDNLIVTIAIMFTSKSYGENKKVNISKGFLKPSIQTSYEKCYSFCSFNPSRDSRELKKSIDWLQDYSKRYSDIENPPILNDFDEHYDHFDNYVEFPLSSISKNDFDRQMFMQYANFYQINVGNNFEFNANSQNFNNSSFNEKS